MHGVALSIGSADPIDLSYLRALRRLEEFEIKSEHKKLSSERKDLKSLLKDEKQQWGKISEEVQETKL